MITISVILLTVLAALFFLSKVNSENLGAFYKWTAALVLLVALSMLAFQSYRSCSKLWHRKVCKGTECSSGFHKGKKSGMNWHQKGRMGMGGDCCMMGDKEFKFISGEKGDSLMMKKMKRMRMNEEGAEVIRESTVDTIDGKIIIKETEIIKK